MISFEFNTEKIIQIVGYVLEKNNSKRISYMRLIKLLYLMDREFLQKWNLTITGDSYCSMKDGPVLSETYNLILERNKNQDRQSFWSLFFALKNKDIVLKDNCKLQNDLLSVADKKTIDKIMFEYGHFDQWKLRDILHDENNYPEIEWKKAGELKTSIKIPINRIMGKLGKSLEHINYIEEDLESLKSENNVLSSCG